MVKAKSGLVGWYEMVKLEYKDGTSRDKRMFIIKGPMAAMCAFYEALKDSMESAVNADSKKFGYTDLDDVHHEYMDDDLMNWRTNTREVKAYEKAKKTAKRDGLMRFLAEETRFMFDDSPYSWLKSLEAAIVATGIEVEPVALVV